LLPAGLPREGWYLQETSLLNVKDAIRCGSAASGDADRLAVVNNRLENNKLKPTTPLKTYG